MRFQLYLLKPVQKLEGRGRLICEVFFLRRVQNGVREQGRKGRERREAAASQPTVEVVVVPREEERGRESIDPSDGNALGVGREGVITLRWGRERERKKEKERRREGERNERRRVVINPSSPSLPFLFI